MTEEKRDDDRKVAEMARPTPGTPAAVRARISGDMVRKAMVRAVELFEAPKDFGDLFTVAGFSNALYELLGMKGGLDGLVVHAILSGRSDVEQTEPGHSHYRLREPAKQPAGWKVVTFESGAVGVTSNVGMHISPPEHTATEKPEDAQPDREALGRAARAAYYEVRGMAGAIPDEPARWWCDVGERLYAMGRASSADEAQHFLASLKTEREWHIEALEKVKKLEADVKHAKHLKEVANQFAETYRMERDEARKRIAELEAELAKRPATGHDESAHAVRDLQSKLRMSEGHVDALKSKNNRLGYALESANAELAELRKTSEQWKSNAERAAQQIEINQKAYREIIDARDEELCRMEAELATAKAELAKRPKHDVVVEMAERPDELGRVMEERDEARRKLAELEQNMSDASSEIVRMRRLLAESEKSLAGALAVLAEINKTCDECGLVVESVPGFIRVLANRAKTAEQKLEEIKEAFNPIRRVNDTSIANGIRSLFESHQLWAQSAQRAMDERDAAEKECKKLSNQLQELEQAHKAKPAAYADAWIPWRHSVSDLITDLVAALTASGNPKYLDELKRELVPCGTSGVELNAIRTVCDKNGRLASEDFETFVKRVVLERDHHAKNEKDIADDYKRLQEAVEKDDENTKALVEKSNEVLTLLAQLAQVVQLVPEKGTLIDEFKKAIDNADDSIPF